MMTGGTQGRWVGLGPVNGENADEVERLKGLVDRALEPPHHHDNNE
jgi:hypothetical protein